MSQLIFSHAKAIRNRCLKRASEAKNLFLSTQVESAEEDQEVNLKAMAIHQSTYEVYFKKEICEFEEILSIASQLHECFNGQRNKFYAITVRPRPGVTFEEFYETVCRYTQRACITGIITSFEQKGTDDASLGQGFHVHFAIYGYSWRSKGEALRDTISTFGKLADSNCIEVKPSKDDVDKYVQYYLIDYESTDQHKEATKDWDEKWRQSIGLNSIYRGPIQLSSSPRTVVSHSITHDPVVVSWV